MERRIFGLESEYGVTCTLRGQRRLSPDEVARYLFRRVVHWGRSSNVFLAGVGGDASTVPRGAPEEPLPAIIFPHGGPISYEGSGFDYWTQYFASRGYAVLQMNFRGSTGYGDRGPDRHYVTWGPNIEALSALPDGEYAAIETLDDGSDPANPDLDLTAVYTDYYTDRENDTKRRVYVNISITGTLETPLLGFDMRWDDKDGDKVSALSIYKRLAKGQQPKHVRLAATRGMLACAGG